MDGRRIIVCDTDKCTGCEICEYACAVYGEGSFNRSKACIRHVRIEPAFDIALACRKCEIPRCVNSCKRDALIQLPDGSIAIDNSKCDSCGWCVEACNYGSIFLDADRGGVAVCDFCRGLDQPRCVEVCPFEALSYESLDQAGSTPGKQAFRQVLEELV
jgi:carbon-monoxide dehydrogenase iron sulfur subunit